MHEILDLLPTGKQNSIESQTLADLCSYKSVRELQKDIQVLRVYEGYVICSNTQSPGGYYLSDDPTEIKQFILTLRNRANNTLRAVESAEKYLEEIEATGQGDSNLT